MIKWTDELIERGIKEAMWQLNLDRMPTGEELKGIGKNDLHCKISRTRKYSGWANALGIDLKRCTTRTGNDYEDRMSKFLVKKGYEVEQMSTKHPYDLFVNGCVKVDVKVASLRKNVWTFNLSKVFPTCDIYILIALNEDKSTNRVFVIPSHLVKMKTVNLGTDSKYNKYAEKFDYIQEYAYFNKSV